MKLEHVIYQFLATNVGIYYDLKPGKWGRVVTSSFIEEIPEMLKKLDWFEPRDFFFEKGIR